MSPFNPSLTACGIDFGTTNSTLAVFHQNQPHTLPIDSFNSRPDILKSLIYASQNGAIAVGQEAVNKYLNDLATIPAQFPVTKFTGRYIKTFGPSSGGGAGPPIIVPEIIEVDPSGRGRLLQSLKSVLTSTSYQGTKFFDHFYTLTDLLSLILGKIKTNAELSSGHNFTSVVLGRPVRYVGDPAGEQLALDRLYAVAQNVGFKNIEFEYEPVGAALSFGLNINQPQNVLVFDFGGGTLDICIMHYPEKQVLSVSGRPIGGDLVNSHLVEHQLLSYFGKNAIISGSGLPKILLNAVSLNWYQLSILKTVKTLQSFEYFIPNSNDKIAVTNLRDLIFNDLGFSFFAAVDQAKINLSTELQTELSFVLPCQTIAEPIFRSNFNDYIKELVSESDNCIKEALFAASLPPSAIDHVILTGGSSNIPLFVDLLKNFFGPAKLIHSDPFTSVALGLAIRAHQIFG